jgi:hypothetical protein
MTPRQAPPRVHYENAAPNSYEWTERAYDLLVAGKLRAGVVTHSGIQTAEVSGECPHCTHDVNFRQVLDAASRETTGTLGARETAADVAYVPLTVACSCTESHTGRPPAVNHGCGVNFRVDVRRNVGTGRDR